MKHSNHILRYLGDATVYPLLASFLFTLIAAVLFIVIIRQIVQLKSKFFKKSYGSTSVSLLLSFLCAISLTVGTFGVYHQAERNITNGKLDDFYTLSKEDNKIKLLNKKSDYSYYFKKNQELSIIKETKIFYEVSYNHKNFVVLKDLVQVQ